MDPTSQQVRVDAVSHRHRGHRDAGLLRGLHCLRLELGAVNSATAAWRCLLHSAYVPIKSLMDKDIWHLHIDAWASSGLTQADYCARQGLSLKTFARWRTNFLKAVSTGKATSNVPRQSRLVPIRLRCAISCTRISGCLHS